MPTRLTVATRTVPAGTIPADPFDTILDALNGMVATLASPAFGSEFHKGKLTALRDAVSIIEAVRKADQ